MMESKMEKYVILQLDEYENVECIILHTKETEGQVIERMKKQ